MGTMKNTGVNIWTIKKFKGGQFATPTNFKEANFLGGHFPGGHLLGGHFSVPYKMKGVLYGDLCQ